MKLKMSAVKFVTGFTAVALSLVPVLNAAGQPMSSGGVFMAQQPYAAEQPVVPAQSQLPGQPPAGAQALTPSQRITLDIKGMDIVDVLKIISQRAGMNIVASKALAGKVTIFLKDVDVWDAFEIILLANDLAYDKNGNIVTVMTGREYETLYGERFKDKKEVRIIKLNHADVSEAARTLTQVKTAIGRVIVDTGSNTLILMETKDRLAQMEEMIKAMDVATTTKIFSLDYAKSDKLNAKIQDMVTKGVGTIRFDERTNKVAVTDLPEKISAIEKVINAFDEKTRQVLIDAKIVQVELDDKFQAGIDWKVVFQNVLQDLSVQQTLLTGLTSGGKITVASGIGKGKGTLTAVIDFLGTVGKTNIISSPRVTALDGQEAKIMVGTKEAYITATTTTPATGATTTAEAVNFVDVGIQLYVTPTINKEGYVVMKIKPVVSSVNERIPTAGSDEGVPIVKTSEAETSVLVKDGMTIVMGGLMEDRITKSYTKIPVLGDIPFLGLAFRKTANETKKTELVIFLTPTIISGDFAEPIPDMKDSAVYSEYYKGSKMNVVDNVLYYQDIRGRILSAAMKSAEKSQSKISGEAIVSFSLTSKGALIGEPRMENEAQPELTDLALRSVKDSAPFPPFPKLLRKDAENFKVRIAFE